MVKKMSLKFVFFTLTAFLWTTAALADDGFSHIRKRQYVACGIGTEYKPLAYRQDNVWHGFDADICRAVAAAVFGDAERIKLISVKESAIGKALNSGKIDVMLGHSSLTAAEEASQYVIPVDILYMDRQVFASRQKTDARSMRDFTGSNVCVVRDSAAAAFLEEYNQKYALGFNILQQASPTKVKEAFYLNRCDLISDGEIFINGIVADLKSNNPAAVLPEEVAYIPVKAYTAGNNATLNIALRWIINALKLADNADITSQNVDIFNATKSRSLQNLLGIREEAWVKLGLEPEWLRKYLPIYGNYHQILERNFGTDSSLHLDTTPNNLIGRGGFLSFQPFI